VLRWMRRHLGGKGRGALGSMLNGADEMWHATALRGREELELQHQSTAPAPSPRGRLFEDGYLVLPRPAEPQDEADGARGDAREEPG
jgi:hypothetical protein